MNRDIILIGLNHKTAAVEVRERFALTAHCSAECWAIPCGKQSGNHIGEALILSTCNRVEILVCGKENVLHDAQNTESVVEEVLTLWAKARGRNAEELRPYVYIHKGKEAVRHLFTVASSLDSMVVGEPQILGQLKEAYRKAIEGKTTGTIINRLLHKSFSVAKRVRTETAIASSAVSISYAAVELAKRIFGNMQEHSAMLVGAGEMAELAATHLLQAGIQNILVANRTIERGRELARQFHGEAIAFDALIDRLVDVDIIITSTGSPETIIRAKDMRQILRLRKHRPMFFIDIAVPRDIDPDVNGLDNVYLYDIDDLKEVVEENLANRRDEALKAANIVEDEVAFFCQWLKSLDVQPTIVELIQRAEHIAEEELARTLKRLGSTDEETREALEAMTTALIRKLNHAPIAFLKRGTMAEEGTAPRISLLRRIFDLDSKNTH